MLEIVLLFLFVLLIVAADFAQGQREASALERSRERWETFNAAQQAGAVDASPRDAQSDNIQGLRH
jgi:hypothetical protein